MDHCLSYLHPEPGWSKTENSSDAESVIESTGQIFGKHLILELYDCDQIKLNDEAFLRTTITTSAKSAGATLLNLITHRFNPQGVTGLALLAESHISIHTWPEIGYAAIDVFTCGEHTMPEAACDILKKEFLASRYTLKRIKRDPPKDVRDSLREPIK